MTDLRVAPRPAETPVMAPSPGWAPEFSFHHFTTIADLDATQLLRILHLAQRIKAEPQLWRNRRSGGSVACIFEKPSTRTRVSFATAAHRLGMLPQVIAAQEMQLARGETVADTARALSQYVDVIVLRTFAHERITELAAASTVPVINALSNSHHPCQALADLLTLQERFGSLSGRKVAYVGDADSNIGHSLMQAAALVGLHLVIAAPVGYRPDPLIEAGARATATVHGGRIEVTDDPEYALRDADAVYPEIWVPMDKEHLRAERVADLSPYRVDTRAMGLARPGAVFLHCLPAYRGQEVTAEVIDGRQSLVWQQAGNRLPTTQALLYALTGPQG
jgi:ornithine carbamoyltransferase